ncbi:MAG: YjjG family noncanonical pyrimidine nucleotidase [Ruminococcus sp.]|nr:YjjG family noncanonical pyrimidine nucleotidase [Ruminococcus sp.]
MSNSNLQKQRFDIVLLDADETIFDFKKAEAHSFKQMLESFDIEYTDERLDRYSEINLKMWKALERGEVTRERLKTLRFEKFFSEIGVSGIDCVEVNDRYLTNLSNSTFMIDGAPEFVKELHKYCKIYLATNGLTKAQTGRFFQSAVKDFIDGMFISEQIGFAKPDKAYFDYIFDSIGVSDKSRVIMLGDSLTSDMQGGRNAGITTCRYNRDGEIVDSPLCDYQITEYVDFFDILFAK